MRKGDLSGRRVWITGASSGIGREVARQLAKCGCRLALSARRAPLLEELVEELGPDRAHAFPLDVTDRRANLAAIEAIRNLWGGLDIAFLNAGACEYLKAGPFDSAVFDRMMTVNYFSTIYGIEAALPLLRESPHPLLAGMSSTAAYRGLPRTAAYGASKAAVKYLLESLRFDLAPEGIPVSIVEPGFVRTPLIEGNTFAMPGLINAEKAARIIVNGIAQRREEIHFPRKISLVLTILGVLPSPVYTWLITKTVHRP